MPEAAIRTRCDGYAKFLRKPFDFDETLGTVVDVIGDAAA
jgi:hypothetical protein